MEIRLENPAIVRLPDNEPGVYLKEVDGERFIVFNIHIANLYALQLEFGEVAMPQPNIYRCIREFMTALSANIERVVIDELKDGHFYSYVYMKDAKSDINYKFGLSVTDATILAVSAKIPIFIMEEVFEQIEVGRQKEKDEEVMNILLNIDPNKMIKH